MGQVASQQTAQEVVTIAEILFEFLCPKCREAIAIIRKVYNAFEIGSGFDCFCPHCNKRIKKHYNDKVISNKRYQHKSTGAKVANIHPTREIAKKSLTR